MIGLLAKINDLESFFDADDFQDIVIVYNVLKNENNKNLPQNIATINFLVKKYSVASDLMEETISQYISKEYGRAKKTLEETLDGSVTDKMVLRYIKLTDQYKKLIETGKAMKYIVAIAESLQAGVESAYNIFLKFGKDDVEKEGIVKAEEEVENVRPNEEARVEAATTG